MTCRWAAALAAIVWAGVSLPGAAAQDAPPPADPAAEAPASRATAATLDVHELGFEGRLRIRLYHDPGFLPVPGTAGTLLMVAADSAAGKRAFFIPTDLALEIGTNRVYRATFERTADLFGQPLGGRLRPGELQLGCVLVPPEVELDRLLATTPDSVVLRYANQRAPMHPASTATRTFWESAVDRRLLASGLTEWWGWYRDVNAAPAVSQGEWRFVSEQLFPGQGHIVRESELQPERLRNALLRVSNRQLFSAPARQRVAPLYPTAMQQLGITGLVIVMCYVTDRGEVADATVLASDTVHLLNVSSLAAAMEWRFQPSQDENGRAVDGWRLLPFQFALEAPVPAEAVPEVVEGYVPPRAVRVIPAEYPERARQTRIEGTVIWRITVDRRGKMVQAALEEGVHPILDQAAMEAIEQYLFVPAQQDGAPVSGEILIPVQFPPSTEP